MAKSDVVELAVEWSFDELSEALANTPDLPRAARRAALSDARRFVASAEAGGMAPGSVRFRATVCDCCGVLEVVGAVASGARRPLH